MKRRLDVLDGLRGFAIILVVLNHIDSHYIAESVPNLLKPSVHFLFSSGNLGVTFFFILSGFLMEYLYSHPQPSTFIEKRYARIFPPFLVMVICMWIFSIFPATSLVLRIALILGIALLGRLTWVLGIEKYYKGEVVIKLFLFLQLLVAIWYGIVVMRHPSIWFDSLPFFVKSGSILAVNATLTLPLGNYIPLLDGVYWSLAPEMLFYLLYPYLFARTAETVHKKSRVAILFFILSLFFLFFGLSLLFKHSQGLTMLFIEYFIYFCGGIVVASIVRRSEKSAQTSAFHIVFNPIIFLIFLFSTYLALRSVSGYAIIIVRLLLVIPYSYIVYFLIHHKTPLSNLFNHKLFLYLGTISYSIYIGHTALIDGLHLFFKPKSSIDNILFLLLAGILIFVVAATLHEIIEKPYFIYKQKSKQVSVSIYRSKMPYYFLLAVVTFLFFSTYTSRYNFFSTQKKYKDIIPSTVIITDRPSVFTFIAKEDSMGIIQTHITYKSKSLPTVPQKNEEQFQIRMKEKGSKTWYASQSASPAQIGDSAFYPLGFPPISNSKDKTYIIEMVITNPDPRSTILFHNDSYDLVSIHQISKQSLLTHPTQLISLLSEKALAVATDPEARLVALCITPFFILLFLL